MAVRLVLITFLALVTMPQKSWCQIVCQQVLQGDLQSQQAVRAELKDLHQSGMQNLSSPLAAILRNKFYEKLQVAIDHWGPSFDFLVYPSFENLPNNESTTAPKITPPVVPSIINPYFESESYAPKIEELIGNTVPQNRRIIRPLPNTLPWGNFEYRISESTFKEYNEYFFMLPGRILAVEPLERRKKIFGPTDMSTTGAVSNNERYALLFHASKILVWDLQNTTQQPLSTKEALYSFAPNPVDAFKEYDTLYFKVANSGQWIVNPLHGFLINLPTGQIRKIAELTNLRAQEVQFTTDAKSEVLYFLKGDKIIKLDLKNGIASEPKKLAEIPNQQRGPPISLDGIEVSPNGNFIAVRSSVGNQIILLNRHGEILAATAAFEAPQSRWSDLRWSEDESYLIAIGESLNAGNSLTTNVLMLNRVDPSYNTHFTIQDFYGAKVSKASGQGFSLTGSSKNTTLQKNYRLE